MASYVLLVESDSELQRQITDVLREAHYELSSEREAVWARRSLLVRSPDALVVGTKLADGTGFEVAEELRKDPEAAQVPIFFLANRHWGASHASETHRRFAPAAYLPMPIDVNSLLARLLDAVPPQTHGTPAGASVVPPVSDAAQEKEGQEVEHQVARWTEEDKTYEMDLPPELAAAHETAAIALPSVDSAKDETLKPIKGSLQRRSFAQVLQLIYRQRRSGALLMVRDQTKKIVYFSDGYPLAVRSNVLSECLGELLVSRKHISGEILEQSVHLMKTQGRQQGEILVEMGVLSPHGLDVALREQMEEKLFDLFSWRQGDFSFKDGVAVVGSPVHLDRSTAALIWEGVRRGYASDRQEDVLNACAGKFLAPTSDPTLRMQDMTADPGERRFIASLDGTRMLEQVLNIPPIPKDRARSLLVALIEAGMIEASNQPLDVPVNDVDVDAVVPGRGLRSATELMATLETMRSQTHFQLLGVDENTDGQQVESAYVRLLRSYHPDAYRTRSPDVRDLVDQIFRRLNEARNVLREPTKRASYMKRLQRARSQPGADERAVAAAEAVYYTGIEHLQHRRFDDAVQALRNATLLVPGQAGYHNALGWALYRRSPTSAQSAVQAKQELEHAIALDDEDPWLKVSLGRFLSEIGNPEGAVAAFEAAVRTNPDLPDIQQELRRLRGHS